jgi:hypothetical protein
VQEKKGISSSLHISTPVPAASSQPCLAVQGRITGRRIAEEVLRKSALGARGNKRIAFGQQAVWNAE